MWKTQIKSSKNKKKNGIFELNNYENLKLDLKINYDKNYEK
jgi:hypothetical protein